jgi:hypothetical protein
LARPFEKVALYQLCFDIHSADYRNPARYREATSQLRRPRPPVDDQSSDPEERARLRSIAARQNWKIVCEIARRAGADDFSSDSSSHEGKTDEEIEELRLRKAEARRERDKNAKMMDLQYFLEMVDQKHRYGSNLRAFHNEWKKADTNENFFYWLDEGEGKDIELPTVSRERLNSEQVRYLTREERRDYLVQIDQDGRLCWARNGLRISTDMEWKDSLNGIVPVHDKSPAYTSQEGRIHRTSSNSSFESSSSSERNSFDSTSTEAERYVNYELKQAKGVRKIRHVSAAALLNHLLRKTVKPNTWIFVADTSFRLYVGIKQSGAFQHSSFLHGARIAAAGLIKIKDGQLRRLSPLSGHYRPPAANFRAFVHSLRDAGADMSRVSISRSYAVLVGLEAYVRTRRKIKHGVEKVEEEVVGIIHPEEKKRREEERRDKSKSAARERQLLEAQALKEHEVRKEKRKALITRLWAKWRASSKSSTSPSREQKAGQAKKMAAPKEDILSKPGQDPESGIAPEGKR